MVLSNDLRIWLILMFLGYIDGQRHVFFSNQTTYLTGSNPHGVAAADVNGDNQNDILVANYGSNNVGILFNQGHGIFTNRTTYSTGSSPFSVAAADLNGDNKPDLIIPNNGVNTISVLLNKGNGIYANQNTYITDYNPTFVSIDDVNGDTYLDIIVSHMVTFKVEVLLNIGNGTFTNPTTYSTDSLSWCVATGDLNGDNRSDIVIANYKSNTTGVYLNMGNGTFMTQKTYPTEYDPESVALGDVNVDNRTDIVVANLNSNTISILLNAGNGTFQSQITYPTSSGPHSVAIADINVDNWPDIIVANRYANSIGIFLNIGNGTFISQMTYSTDSEPCSVVVADVNNDNKLDIIVANFGSNNTGIFLCIDYEEETTTLSNQVTTIQTCFSPEITLIPNGNSSKPVSFRRREDLLIVSMIKLNCIQSSAIKLEWIIRNCTTLCSNRIQLKSTIVATLNELFIPSQTLSYGVYLFELTIRMTNSSWLNVSKSTYIQIISSNIMVSSFSLGTLMVIMRNTHDLLLDPGRYSIDLDTTTFNASDWTYQYYCRIYGSSAFLPIENSTCLSNRTDNQTTWKYSNSIRSSSLRILGESFQSNRIYQFMIQIQNRQDLFPNATGYTLVQIENIRSSVITIGCVIWTMCQSDSNYQRVNPTTQVALFSICNDNCTNIENIKWNVYFGSNGTTWIRFNQLNIYENICFFGINTNNLTVTNQLFLTNPSIQFWKFEVIYSFINEINISSSLNFLLNQPPQNGSCLISPENGTTSTLFTISCSNWFDENEIKDYSLYTWTTDPSEKIMIAYWPFSQYQLRLPSGNNQTSLLNLIVLIRDQIDCVTEYNLPSVYVQSDFILNIEDLSNKTQINSILQLLRNENQPTMSQILISFSQQFNRMNDENIQQTIANDILTTNIFISSLNNQQILSTYSQSNQSTYIQFKQQLNFQANLREYLILFAIQLPISTFNSIQLQSSILVQLTKATNQLTRLSITTAMNKCYQLTLPLDSIVLTLSFEDVQFVATLLIQCATNLLTAVNSPLQGRTPVLDLDVTRATVFPTDYDTDLESEWSKLNLESNQNMYYQKQLANQIQSQTNEIISKLTSILNIHLNIGQQLILNSSQVFMFLQTQSIDSLRNQQIANIDIRLPSIFQINTTFNSTISIRSIMQPLAAFGNSKLSANTNLSRSISLSILDQQGNEISIQANETHPIEIIIPRDPNIILPPMILQNVTSTNSTPHQQLFHLHFVNLSSSLPISIHIEIHPLNTSLAYLFIYKFDQIPQLNSSVNQIDGWTIFCPSNLSNDSVYTYFLNNQLTQNHQSLIFGLRELNSSDCLNSMLTNQRYNFTSNYGLRVYSAGCYYLDENNQWQGQGLLVGPLTNHYQTQCFSTHLTTFAGGFLVLPEPINWQYVFANADFMKNKTIYLTVILIYLLVMIYARYHEKKDLKKLGVIPRWDNDRSDQYFYEILVFTGHRRESGTNFEVQFVLAGDQDQTQIRTLANSKRDIFQIERDLPVANENKKE